jgi:hypothetical protein
MKGIDFTMISFLRFGAGAVLAGALLSGVWGASAQVQSAHPAFEGVWKIATSPTTLLPHSAVPFTAKGRTEYDNNRKLQARRAYDDYDITISRCSSPGVPRLMLTPMRFKIWDRIGFVTFDFEWNRAIRQIDLRATSTKEPSMMGEDLVPTMTGDSRGKWEGDTLVATTTNLSERTLLDDLLPHSVDMKVTERFRLIDPNTLENRVTINDPEYYTKPWDAVITYKRQPDAIFPEDVCLDRIEAKKPAFPKP